MKLSLKGKQVAFSIGGETLTVSLRLLTTGEYQELIAYQAQAGALPVPGETKEQAASRAQQTIFNLLRDPEARAGMYRIVLGAVTRVDPEFDVEDANGKRVGTVADLMLGAEGSGRFFQLFNAAMAGSSLTETEAKN